MSENIYDSNKVLFAVVGTGKENKQDEDKNHYLATLLKAIDSSDAKNVVLLCSQKSIQKAQQVKEKYQLDRNIEIETLLEPGMEFDADKCFKFIEEVFRKVLDKGYKAENITIDFTHGTKPMSAALYAVGMRYQILTFQYIQKQLKAQDNGSIEFVEGQEIVKTFDAAYAKWLAVIDECRVLFKNWQFSAMALLLSRGKPPKSLKLVVEQIKILSQFYEAWDRLDYVTALECFPEFSDPMGFVVPDSNVKNFLLSLNAVIKTCDTKKKTSLTKDDFEHNKKLAMNIMFDLYANGLRRLEAGLLEDAGIRAYKMAELLGQIYLFEKGYMADCIPANDIKAKKFAEQQKFFVKESSIYFKPFGRKDVMEFLKYLGDTSFKVGFLKDIDKDIQKTRNKSILVHGYSCQVDNKKELKDLFERIIYQLHTVEDFEKKKQAALFMNSFKDIQ